MEPPSQYQREKYIYRGRERREFCLHHFAFLQAEGLKQFMAGTEGKGRDFEFVCRTKERNPC